MAGIKARAKQKGDSVQVKMLMQHPMESGQRKDKQGNRIPAYHITEVTIKAGQSVLMQANFGPAVSKNPYLSMFVNGPQKGDVINIGWIDNQGKTANIDVVVK